MSEANGTDNPAFTNDEESNDRSSGQNGQTPEQAHNNKTESVTENGHKRSFVSQHYVEPTRTSSEPRYKSETRIEVPGENTEKTPVPAAKQNDVHGNGNNNDASFLNTSNTSIPANGNVADTNNKKEQIEAVNLELVSMRPYAGSNNLQTKGQEACEVPSDPYEEYFVPVNEHRKYIRGEKLYVTKDKRSKSSYWRRLACWGFGIAVLSIAVIIAILAATGVILTQEATQPLENGDVSSSHDYGGVRVAGSQEFIKNPPSTPPPDTSSFSPWPTTDETIYHIVPRAIEGSLKLEDMHWEESMSDPKSRVYHDITQQIEDSLENLLRSDNDQPVIKVHNINKDGEVRFRVNYPSLPSPQDNEEYINNILKKNGYHIGNLRTSKVTMNVLMDDCQNGRLDCDSGCKYDYADAQFKCTCTGGKVFDQISKTCVEHDHGHHAHHGIDDVSYLSSTETNKNAVQGRSRLPDSFFDSDLPNWNHDDFDVDHNSELGDKVEPDPGLVPELNATPETESQPQSKQKSTSEPESKAEPEPSLEPETAVDPQPNSEIELSPKPEQKSESEPNVEPAPASESETKSESESTSDSEPKSEPMPAAESEPKSESEISVESKPSSDPEIILETKAPSEPGLPESELKPHSEPGVSLEPKSQSEPKSTEEPESKSEHETQSKPEVLSDTETKKEPEPEEKPESISETETKTESEPSSERAPTVKLDSAQSGHKDTAGSEFDNVPSGKSFPDTHVHFEPVETHHSSESLGEPKVSPGVHSAMDISPRTIVSDIGIEPHLNSQITITEITPPPLDNTEIKHENENEKVKSNNDMPPAKSDIPENVGAIIIPLVTSIESDQDDAAMDHATIVTTITTVPTQESVTEKVAVEAQVVPIVPAMTNTSNDYLADDAAVSSPVAPKIEETSAEHNEEHEISDEKFEDDMSPFLPDVHKEKENTKKAPRLDIDEQYEPNPFELHVEDVITTQPEKLNSGTTEKYEVTDKSTSTTSMKIVSDIPLSNPSTESSIPSSNKKETIPKQEENGLEDQYNDINDESVPKGFDGDEIEVIPRTKNGKKTVDVQEIYIPQNKNVENEKSKDFNNTMEKMKPEMQKSEDESEIEVTTLIPAAANENHTDDVATSTTSSTIVTTDIPILPIEIMQELSTTEIIDMTEPPKMYEDEKSMINKSSDINQSTEMDEEMMTTMNYQSSTAFRTTEPVPIMPDELSTTKMTLLEDQTESTTEDMFMKETEVDASDSTTMMSKEEEIPATENITKLDTPQIVEKTSKIMEMESTTSTSKSSSEEEVTTHSYNLPTNDIKPVSETIVEDTTPQTFEFKYAVTNAPEEPTTLSNSSEELSEEELRVIPLDNEGDDNENGKMEKQKTDFAKNLDLNNEEHGETIMADQPASPDAVQPKQQTLNVTEESHVPKMISHDMDNSKHLHTLKITEITGTNQTGPAETEKINDIPVKKYPNFIPVSEEVDEMDYKGFTEPTVLAFNPYKVDVHIPPMMIHNETHLIQDMNNTSAATNETLITEQTKAVSGLKTEMNHETLNSNVNTTVESHIIPVHVQQLDIIPQVTFSKCTSGQFQCANGTARDGAYCVSLSAKCDSENDCSDGSDELNCEKEGCPGNFQCSSGQCLKRHLVCNGIVDCDDGSDEKECKEWKCNFDEFQCLNGRCIPSLWQCDGRPDCENHADEYNCSESCGNDEYLCSGEKWCIPQTWHCNGIPECADGEDEKLCDCALDQFKCQTGGCIPTEQICDGVEHCPDRSDEWDCIVSIERNSSITAAPSEVDENAKDVEFTPNSRIVKIKRSNGERRSVCSDGWTQEFSDAYCRSLGFSASELTQMVAREENSPAYRLKKDANSKSSFITNLEPTDSCQSEKVVEVSCHEFSCGSHEAAGPTARLVGGTPAGEGQWSSVALLKEPKLGAACTASVLSPTHALASYSCIHRHRQSNGWQLYVGGNLLKSIKVKDIISYPQVKYNQFLYNNDIALIELAEPLIFSRNVSAVCLPRQSLQPRQLCVTAGWGFPVNGELDLQQYLKFLPVPTYDSADCNATSHYAGFITQHNICAGFTDTDKGPCYNDEGAPLMCINDSGRWEIQGLLSHHSRCSRGHPAIYSSLAPALSWLRHSVPALQMQA